MIFNIDQSAINPWPTSSSYFPVPPINPADPKDYWRDISAIRYALPAGCHIVTKTIQDAMPELSEFEVGLANLFIQHTSASLTVCGRELALGQVSWGVRANAQLPATQPAVSSALQHAWVSW
jgi:hypothetical protein